MTGPDIAVAEALAARLCHDLAGMAGMVANLLDLATAGEDEALTLTLARDAAVRLVRRLRVCRAAWGGDSGWPGTLDDLARDLAHDGLAVSLDQGTRRLGRAPALGRLLLNVALLGADRLGGRGTITFRAGPDAVAVVLAGAVPEWPRLEAADAGGPGAFQQGWTVRLAAACDARLAADGPVLRLVLPA